MNTQKSFSEIVRTLGPNVPNILRLPAVKKMTGYSRSAIYLKVNQGVFPQPIALGDRAIGWLESEVIAWIEKRIAISRKPADKPYSEGPHHDR